MDTKYALGIVLAGLIIIGGVAATHRGPVATNSNATSTPVTPTTPPSTPTPVTPTTPTPTTPSNNQSVMITLGLGQSGTTKNVTLKPLTVVEDSRCPANVQCIQAGTVRLSMQVTANGGATTQTFTLGRALIARGARITLTGVTPAKTTTGATDASAYRFTFSVEPVTATTPTPTTPVATGGCYVGGCSGQLCTDEPNAVSTCEYTAAYACYKTAECKRQSSGQCGWTQTAALQQCLADSSSGPLIQNM